MPRRCIINTCMPGIYPQIGLDMIIFNDALTEMPIPQDVTGPTASTKHNRNPPHPPPSTRMSEYQEVRMLERQEVMVADQEEVEAMIEQGRREVRWSICVGRMWTNHRYHQRDMDPLVFCLLLDQLVWTWPRTLTQRLPWGPMPHFGALGGISGFRFEATLDQLDYIVAETVCRTGRTPWTDLAWRMIALLGMVQRRCPDCGQSGPQGQMALFGAIYACDLCQGVNWGSGAL